MKIHLRGRPKQFNIIKVTCLDSIMVDMLSCAPDAHEVIQEEQIINIREAKMALTPIFVFTHGSRLLVGDAKNEYFIQPLHPDGSDGAAAIEELKMYDHLRLAKKHFLEMKKVCYHPNSDSLSLRVTRY